MRTGDRRDGVEALAVQFAAAVFPEGLEVFGGAVAFVLGKAVKGVERILAPHQAVPVDLGQDGGRGDAGGKIVSVDHGLGGIF